MYLFVNGSLVHDDYCCRLVEFVLLFWVLTILVCVCLSFKYLSHNGMYLYMSASMVHLGNTFTPRVALLADIDVEFFRCS